MTQFIHIGMFGQLWNSRPENQKPSDSEGFEDYFKTVDFVAPAPEVKQGYFPNILKQTCLGVVFSLCSIGAANEAEIDILQNQVEALAAYDPDLSCSVPSDVGKAFLYSNNYSGNSIADLIVDHPESTYFNQIHFYHFKQQVRDLDGFGLPDAQVIGACFFEKHVDGKEQFFWADAFNVSVAGTREQLSWPVYEPVITNGGLAITHN